MGRNGINVEIVGNGFVPDEEIIEYVKKNFYPDECCNEKELHNWALENGYVKQS